MIAVDSVVVCASGRDVERPLVQFIVVRSAVKEHVRIEQLKNVQLKSADC